MTFLLDGNVLVALAVDDHVFHDRVRAWWKDGDRFATSPITQGTLLRLLIRDGVTAADAVDVLAGITGHTRHDFWADDLAYTDVALSGVIGHRQVTDAYLTQLARDHRGHLATLDRGLASLHGDVAVFIGD